MSKQLFFGDNLQVMRDHIADESVDLVYLDPPFNSKRDYNLLFKTPKGHGSDAQIVAFEDSWHWGEQAEREYHELVHGANTDLAILIQALRSFLKENDMMAYLVMMANRLLELHRVLKPTGSLYLHCDPTASHYLKLILDGVFDARAYVNEISWRRTTSKADHAQGATHYPRVRDIIFLYRKSFSATGQKTYNQQFIPYDDSYTEGKYSHVDEKGRRYRLDNLTGPGGAAKGNPSYEVMGVVRHWRYSKIRMAELIAEGRIIQTKPGSVPQYKRYLDEMPGVPVSDDWDDIRPINSQAAERLGYPTQKPLALLERIINVSSNPNDVVLDPFCGCGTAVHAAEKLGRQWIGIDITHLSIALIEKRMTQAFPALTEKGAFHIEGVPRDFAGAADLALRDKYQFQFWALSLVQAQPYKGGKKGADGGVDGFIFAEVDKGKTEKIIVSVKGGGVTLTMLKDLFATVAGNNAAIGLFVTLQKPTKPMIAEAAAAGHYESPLHGIFPKIQILTIEGLLSGSERPNYPDMSLGQQTFKTTKVAGKTQKQDGLF